MGPSREGFVLARRLDAAGLDRWLRERRTGLLPVGRSGTDESREVTRTALAIGVLVASYGMLLRSLTVLGTALDAQVAPATLVGHPQVDALLSIITLGLSGFGILAGILPLMGLWAEYEARLAARVASRGFISLGILAPAPLPLVLALLLTALEISGHDRG